LDKTKKGITIAAILIIPILLSLPSVNTLLNINNINPLSPNDRIYGNDKVTFILTRHNQTILDALNMYTYGWIPSSLFNSTISYTTVSYNKITNVGANFLVDNLFGTSSITTFVANYLALSQDSTTPAYTDTSCTNEATVMNLNRSIGAYTSNVASAGSVVITLQTTWTAKGTYANINKVCVWTGQIGTGVTLFSTVLMPSIPINMVSGDTLKVVYQPTFTY